MELAVVNAESPGLIRYRSQHQHHGKSLFSLGRFDNTLSQHCVYILPNSSPWRQSRTILSMRMWFSSELICSAVVHCNNLDQLAIPYNAMFRYHLAYFLLAFGWHVVEMTSNYPILIFLWGQRKLRY